MKAPLFIGKLTYILTLPGIRKMLRGSQRVYVVIKVKDEILVTKNWLGLHKTWRLPGGGIQKTEAISQALRREVKEELGINIVEKDLQAVQGNPYLEPRKNFTYWLYVLSYTTKPELNINAKEIVAAEWIHISKLRTAPLSEELKIALKNIK